jgi:hypothetical protein
MNGSKPFWGLITCDTCGVGTSSSAPIHMGSHIYKLSNGRLMRHLGDDRHICAACDPLIIDELKFNDAHRENFIRKIF